MPTSVITIVSVLFVSALIAAVLLWGTRYPEFWIIGLTNPISRAISGGIVLFGIKNLNRHLLSWQNPLKVMRAFLLNRGSVCYVFMLLYWCFSGYEYQIWLFAGYGGEWFAEPGAVFSPTPEVQVWPQRRASLYYFLSCCLVVLLVLWFYGVYSWIPSAVFIRGSSFNTRLWLLMFYHEKSQEGRRSTMKL